MAYLMVFVLLVAVVGAVALAVVRAKDDRPTAADVGRRQVTDRGVEPPAHPDDAVPGSATSRHRKGKP